MRSTVLHDVFWLIICVMTFYCYHNRPIASQEPPQCLNYTLSQPWLLDGITSHWFKSRHQCGRPHFCWRNKHEFLTRRRAELIVVRCMPSQMGRLTVEMDFPFLCTIVHIHHLPMRRIRWGTVVLLASHIPRLAPNIHLTFSQCRIFITIHYLIIIFDMLYVKYFRIVFLKVTLEKNLILR